MEIRKHGYVIKKEDAQGNSLMKEDTFRKDILNEVKRISEEVDSLKSALKKLEEQNKKAKKVK